MKFDLGLTDICLFLLLFCLALTLWKSLQRQPTRIALSQAFQKPAALLALMVFLSFLAIALLDSLPIQKAGTHSSLTLLDRIVAPINSVHEQSYSAPLALYAYGSELKLKEGKVKQYYPRLDYPNAAIKTQGDKYQAIALSIGRALVFSTIFSLIAYLLLSRGRVRLDPSSKTLLFGLFSLALLASLSYWLSRDFHLLGTGKIGQDIFYASLKSIRTGMVIGFLTTLFMLPLALLLGIMAGYFGGIIDDIVQYIYTTLSSIPGVLLITAAVLAMQTFIANHPKSFPTLDAAADARLLSLCLILGVTSWTSLCRLLRAEVLKLREMDFLLAARAMGSSLYTILFRHLLPNVLHIVLICLVIDFSFLVLAEAVLSYVGVGVSPLTYSFGNMINVARLELAREPIVWWPVASAFAFMLVLVLSSNLLADALREAFDPRGQT